MSIHLTDEAYDPPTLRLVPIAARLDVGFSDGDPHIAWDREAAVFIPRAPGHRLPVCSNSEAAQGELDCEAYRTIARFLVWLGGLS